MKFSKIGAVVIGLLFSGGVYAECVSDVNKGGNLPRKSNPSTGYRYGDIWLDIAYDNGKIIGTDIITD